MSASEGRGNIPVEEWTPHPVSDSADYLDQEPVYASDLTGDAKAEFDAAVAAREPKMQQHPPPKRSRAARRRGRKKS